MDQASVLFMHAVETPVRGHSRKAEKVSENGAGRLRKLFS